MSFLFFLGGGHSIDTHAILHSLQIIARVWAVIIVIIFVCLSAWLNENADHFDIRLVAVLFLNSASVPVFWNYSSTSGGRKPKGNWLTV